MGNRGRDPFNQNSALSSLRASSPIWVSEESLERTRVLARLASLAQSDREKWSTSKGGPVFSKRFRLDRTDPLSFGPKFPEILVKWIAPIRAPGIGNGCFQSPSFQDHVTKKRRAVGTRMTLAWHGPWARTSSIGMVAGKKIST